MQAVDINAEILTLFTRQSVKAMLDSHVKETIHFQNSIQSHGIELMNTKINLIFLFIALLLIILFNKWIILDTVFSVYNVMILASVYATFLGVNFCINLLMSSTQDAFDECDIFDKAIQLSVIVHDNNEPISIKNCRSRYEKFVHLSRHTRTRAVRIRDREPSRIPLRKITSILHKSRNVRRMLPKYIKKNIPSSSRMHIFVSKSRAHNVRSRQKGKRMKYLLSSKRMHRKFSKHRIKLKTNYYPDQLMKSTRANQSNACSKCHSVPSVYKNVNHRINHCKFNLSKDVETNPGPPIDPTKTIQAPYSQDNVLLFGSNAGTQCVAMSLMSLVYNHKNGITSSVDLVNIMNIGNELYSGLSRLSRQSYLLLTEVPEMITVCNTNYQLQYSPSYTGAICDSCAVEDFNYCMPLENSIQALLQQNYNSFFLTILSTTVAIYCTTDGKFKISDSHARDLFGMPHPQGKCVLLEVDTLNQLITYFQYVYQSPDVLFEIKGVHITEMLCDRVEVLDQQSNIHERSCNTDTNTVSRNIPLECCCAISFYSICFSMIKSCGYWNVQTLEAIVDHASIFYREKLYINNQDLTINDFPSTLQIYDADISIAFNLEKQGRLCCTSFASKLVLQNLIKDNTKHNTGFLMWISNYCISCIFEHKVKGKTNTVKYYLVALNPDAKLNISQGLNNLDSLSQSLLDIIKKEFHSRDKEYCIKFLCCSSNISNATRQKVMAKHKSNGQKRLNLKRQQQNYAQMEPAIKKKCLIDQCKKYKSMDPLEKEKLLKKKGMAQ